MPSKETLLKDAARYINSWLEYKFEHSDIPGLAIGIQYENQLLLNQTYGYADLDKKTKLSTEHLFQIASQSKMFTSVAIFQLVDQGLLQLDDKLSKHLRWFKSSKDKRIEQITIRQLLSHGAGFTRDGKDASHWDLYKEFPKEKEFKDYVKSSKAIIDSNVQFKYSNFGFAALGMLIKKITKTPYEEYIRKNITSPLKLNSTAASINKAIRNRIATGYSLDMHGMGKKAFRHVGTHSMASATGFYSNTKDLCKFGSSLFFNNNSLLPDHLKREAFKEVWNVQGEGRRYGLGFALGNFPERTVVGHSGSFPGFLTCTRIDPNEKIVVTVLINSLSTNAALYADSALKLLYYYLDRGQQKTKSNRKDLKKFQSRLYSRWGAIDTRLIGNSLCCFHTDSDTPTSSIVELEQTGKTEFKVSKCGSDNIYGEPVRYYFNQAEEVKYANIGGFKKVPKEEFLKKFYN